MNYGLRPINDPLFKDRGGGAFSLKDEEAPRFDEYPTNCTDRQLAETYAVELSAKVQGYGYEYPTSWSMVKAPESKHSCGACGGKGEVGYEESQLDMTLVAENSCPLCRDGERLSVVALVERVGKDAETLGRKRAGTEAYTKQYEAEQLKKKEDAKIVIPWWKRIGNTTRQGDRR